MTPATTASESPPLVDGIQPSRTTNEEQDVVPETKNKRQGWPAEKASNGLSPAVVGSKNSTAGNSATTSDVIDSALLAALRDPRERLGLLKLEQTLLDFLEKQPQDSYVDIGGPYNSTVISPSLGYIGQQSHQQLQQQPNTDGMNGRPQTTFQRCILHRICDRFNMTRENSYTTDIHGCYLIRVCKGPDSKKPPRRLWSVKESEYQIQRPPPSESNNLGLGGSSLTTGLSQMTISSTSSSAIPNNGPGGTTVPMNAYHHPATSTRGKVRKMKIMKRSGSNVSNSSNGSNNNKAKNACTKTRSTLSEKERKYAEARARIFEQEATTRADIGEDSTTTSSFAQHTSDNNSLGEAHTLQANSGQSRQSSSTPPNGPSSKAPLHNNTSTSSLASMGSSNSKGNSSDGGDPQTVPPPPNNNNIRSKATYRNRQQEETDPDFRRGAGMQLPQSSQYKTHAVGYAGGRGGSSGNPNLYYPSLPNNGNPVAPNHRMGYGYGQPQPQPALNYPYHPHHHQQHHHSQQPQHYAGLQQAPQQQQQTHYYTGIPSQSMVGGGKGQYPHGNSSLQYQQQRQQQELHYPALSSTSSRK